MNFWEPGFWQSVFWQSGFWGETEETTGSFAYASRRKKHRPIEEDEALFLLGLI